MRAATSVEAAAGVTSAATGEPPEADRPAKRGAAAGRLQPRMRTKRLKIARDLTRSDLMLSLHLDAVDDLIPLGLILERWLLHAESIV
jgi:hypothetical protein